MDQQEVETTEFRTETGGVRVSMADHDDGVWLHLSSNGATFYVVLTKEEAAKTIKGLQNILEWLEAKT